MLFDTHAHLNFNAYKDDVDEVIKRTLGNEVWVINVGSQYATSKRAIEIAERYPEGVYTAIGLHPIHTNEEEYDIVKYRALAKSKRLVAIGEIGLDFKPEYALYLYKERQREIFLKQLDLAKELDLPVIFHCRMAHDELIDLLKGYGAIKGVIHCFTGNQKQTEEYLKMGLYLGFNGIIFKMDLDKVIKKFPLDRILLETDCPYLTPPPKVGRNEPVYVKYVAEKISKIKNIEIEELKNITTQNAKRLFKI